VAAGRQRAAEDAGRHLAQLATTPANLPAAARQAVFRSMLKNLLLEELPAPAQHRDLGWREADEGAWVALCITADARALFGIGVDGPSDVGAERRPPAAGEEAAELALQQEALMPRLRPWAGDADLRSVAQQERELISATTIAALAGAKARGAVLGG
jgi:hypothetical protein